MDLNELKQKLDSISSELKSKVPKEAQILVESQTVLLEILLSQNERLNETLKDLQETIKELRRQLGQNSKNSSKPPSTDGYKKPRSLRKKSDLKAGGQKGHRGANMELPHEPDEIRKHLPKKCETCPHLTECLASEHVFSCNSSRYVVEPIISTKVIEHQCIVATACPRYEGKLPGEFPPELKAHIQYGNGMIVLAGMLSTYGAVSLNRIHVLLSSLMNVRISTGTISAMVESCARMTKPMMEQIKTLLTQAQVVNFDETGLSAEGKLHWVHNSSNEEYTYQTVSQKRGSDGMNENGVITAFDGVAVHDCWLPYWKYDGVTHAVCCAHLLRELNGIKELELQMSWPEKFIKLLLKMKKAHEKAKNDGNGALKSEQISKFEWAYDEILATAGIECPPLEQISDGRRGRKKKGKTRALIERLLKFKKSVCLFINNLKVPFDNNQAERDVRNVKTKSKISGCFRSLKGAQNYLTIMSYLSTARKHGIDAFTALTAAFDGHAKIILGQGSE